MAKHLPHEIIQTILSHSRPWNLPTLSLVCRLWQALAFPFLYRTILLERYRDATLLVDRINAETEDTRLRITDCARNLVIDLLTPDDVRVQANEKRFCLAISKLVHVERLKFGPTGWLTIDLQLLMPTLNPLKLKYLSLKLDLMDTNYVCSSILSTLHHDNLFLLFSAMLDLFKDLLHISVEMSGYLGIGGYTEPSEPVTLLAAMIRASPELEYLSLTFPHYELEGIVEPSMGYLFSQLSGDVFPRLRTLRAVSELISPTSPPLRHFLLNHPELSTLAFSSLHKSMPRVFGADEIAAIVPAVRHFEGPAYQVKPLLESKISGQLESLSICGSILGWDKDLDLIMRNLSRRPLPELSALRVLRVEPKIYIGYITHILAAAPELEVLEVFGYINALYSPSEYSQLFLQMITLVPRLRVLAVVESGEQDDDNLQPTYKSVMNFLECVTAACPQLDTIHHMQSSAWAGTWRLRYFGSNEEVRVYTYRRMWHLFPLLGLPCVERPSGLGSWSRLHGIH
ncbi:hypothetical protein FRC12_000875 [Ceratobasidium sp. 428]|nr:hypothetical protein FRC12_000875 [Ceratobasidium sp. 428]